ncbi:MAG: glycine dehydrogenase (aminomethyl-transferring), partial [Verrucomicrobiota bacterium]
PQPLAVLATRAEPLDIELVVTDVSSADFGQGYFGLLVQNPDATGAVRDLSDLIDRAHEAGLLVAVGSDLMASALFKPAGEMGADIVYGNAQRFGVPMGYGGPHAAFFACRDEHVREAPGRIIGASVDRHGNPAYRMALQTREQHIRREKAKSNICTAQALLASMAGCYAVYHGPDGLRAIAERIYRLTRGLARSLEKIEGLEIVNPTFFDTLCIKVKPELRTEIHANAEQARINFYVPDESTIQICLDETSSLATTLAISQVFSAPATDIDPNDAPGALKRETAFLTHPVFHQYHSETDMMRYLKRLERKDVGLDTSMIPLGSCTMKLNAASEMIPVTFPGFCSLHPFAPIAQTYGYQKIIEELCENLKNITGLHGVSLQPNSGAQGE